MNAAERLWRGLARRDWEAVRAQFHPSAVIERAGDGERLGVEEYLAEHRVAAGRGEEGEIEVLRSVVDGKSAVIERAGDGERLGVEEYLAEHRVAAGRGEEGEIEVLRSVVDGKSAVIEARAGDRRCAGIYDLHDGRIAGAIEYWA
jgi:hypothetical protein